MGEDSPGLKKMKEHEKNIVEPYLKELKEKSMKPDPDPGGGKQHQKENPKGPF